MKRTIDQAFHLKNGWSDKVWRIKVFKTERNAKILVTYGRVGMMSRTTFLPVRSQFSSCESDAMARIAEKRMKGYIRIPLGAFDALSSRQSQNTTTGPPVHSTTSTPTLKQTVPTKTQAQPLNVGVLPNADPSEWFF